MRLLVQYQADYGLNKNGNSHGGVAGKKTRDPGFVFSVHLCIQGVREKNAPTKTNPLKVGIRIVRSGCPEKMPHDHCV